jgi:hypothetical protein
MGAEAIRAVRERFEVPSEHPTLLFFLLPFYGGRSGPGRLAADY